MALNEPWIALNVDGNGPVFVAGFVLGSLVCLICRFAVDYFHHLRKCRIEDDKTLNVDAAEKGGLKIGSMISVDEDLFSLEKRAFFNQVRDVRPFQPHRTTSTSNFTATFEE